MPCRCLALLAHLALAGLAGVQTLLLLEVENHGVDDKGGEHEEDAGKHPQLYRGQSLRLRGVYSILTSLYTIIRDKDLHWAVWLVSKDL